jgi:predicted DCC family thiol-disulfide oxidoreductase YuxK
LNSICCFKVIKDQIIVFFDGECIFCNRIVLYLMRCDKKNLLLFSSLQGRFFDTVRVNYGLKDEHNSIVVKQNELLYFKSEAVVLILNSLPFRFRLLARILNLLPIVLKDSVYDFIAKNRTYFFSKKCDLNNFTRFNNKILE